jgi:hypothetical protein
LGLDAQPTSYRVPKDVLRNKRRQLCVAKNVLEIALLPKRSIAGIAIRKPGSLLDGVRKLRKIRVFSVSLNEQMQVVRHETVRDNCKPPVTGGLENLLDHSAHGGVISEGAQASVGAEGQRIPIESNVRKRGSRCGRRLIVEAVRKSLA